jgi:hypothetical protein
MSSQIVAIRKNVLIKASLAGGTTFESKIYLPFLPDEMTVKSIHFNTLDGKSSDTANIISYIYSDLVNDVIGTVAANTLPNNINLTFDMARKPINNIYRFDFRDVDDDADQKTGYIMILLEFVQYKSYIGPTHYVQ